ncbi:MAG: Amino-acid carrier protein AlsT [Alphaproteobacteria bacterium ADurb.BinA280]|jgi:alanine or glycine:cation symporter, AGCS family|nr:alanine:cation symporter family protein [Xanthomonadales bacterium]MCC6503820.1 alanine:cation symporter family protein [Aquimonas sp.]OPZ11621.1 MAG: Amino-acid carrier protein AlsT [Alphaproteobacteria bacterium ADurb.BinA280]
MTGFDSVIQGVEWSARVDLWQASLDQQIDGWLRPFADAVSALIFYAVPLATESGEVMFPLIVGWLVLGALVCTLALRFINVRGFMHGFQLLRGDYNHHHHSAGGEVSHFQAFTSAVSGTVGLGNIAGVAVAITLGGPGATLWMILAGVLGMSAKFAECTLGVKYRRQHANGSVSGGPMYYLTRGLSEEYPRLRWLGWLLAIIFAICTMMGAIGAGGMFQSNQAYAQIVAVSGGQESWLAQRAWVFGGVMATLTGIVILGGITRIGRVTEKLVPVMAVLYVVACLVVIAVNIENVPAAVVAIIDGAFTADGVQGGVLGALIVGFRRAAFSNESGLGSAAIAHSAVKTHQPVTEGFVALWEPFIDTVVVCTMTALVIVISGQYLQGNADGVQLTSNAFATVSSWFPYFLTLAVLLFAYSTMVTWGYYGAKAASFLAGGSPIALYGFKLIYLLGIVVGCTMPLASVVDLADGLLFIMAIPNLIGVYLLLPVVRRELDTYWSALRATQSRKS